MASFARAIFRYLILVFHLNSFSPRTILGYWKDLLFVTCKASVYSGVIFRPLLSNQLFARHRLSLILSSRISQRRRTWSLEELHFFRGGVGFHSFLDFHPAFYQTLMSVKEAAQNLGSLSNTRFDSGRGVLTNFAKRTCREIFV